MFLHREEEPAVAVGLAGCWSTPPSLQLRRKRMSSLKSFRFPPAVRTWTVCTINNWKEGFSRGSGVKKNPPACAGDAGSILGLGRSHTPWSHWACAPQPWSLLSRAGRWNHGSPCVLSLRSARREATATRGWPPLATTAEKPHAVMKTQHGQK